MSTIATVNPASYLDLNDVDLLPPSSSLPDNRRCRDGLSLSILLRLSRVTLS
jgi:hypothetical protein